MKQPDCTLTLGPALKVSIWKTEDCWNMIVHREGDHHDHLSLPKADVMKFAKALLVEVKR